MQASSEVEPPLLAFYLLSKEDRRMRPEKRVPGKLPYNLPTC